MTLNELFTSELYNLKVFYYHRNSKVRGHYLSTKNPKIKNLNKLLGYCMAIDKLEEFEDASQHLYLILRRLMDSLKAKENLSEERFCELLLYYDTNGGALRIESSQLFSLIKTEIKRYFYEINNVELKRLFERTNNVKLNVKTFSDLDLNTENEEDTIEEFLDRITFDTNELYISEKSSLLTEWVETNKVKLSKGQNQYLNDPNSIKNHNIRFKHQKALEKKFEKLAIEKFKTTNSKAINLLLEQELLEKILDDVDVLSAILSNLDYISELEGYYDINQDFRVDINRAFLHYEAHTPENKSLIAICELLHKRLNFIERLIESYNIDSKEDVVKRSKFEISKIPSINLEDNEEFPKRTANGNTNEYKKFIQLHKDNFEGKIELPSYLYSWIGYCKWIKKNKISKDERYYLVYLENQVLLLPQRAYKLFNVENKPIFDKLHKRYRGCVTFDSKKRLTSLTEDYEKCKKDIVELRNIILQEFLIKYKDDISSEAYEKIKDYKFTYAS